MIVSAVKEEEMLASIVNSKEGDVKALSVNETSNTTSLEFSVGETAEQVSHEANAKAGAVAGGMALRSLVKGGKLAANNNDDEKAVQSA
ncbi:Variable major outer membrane lipoprotein (plasmid) [Borrelia crocidurae DOU]|uniref:Variable large protein n=1 Tax=Borrelia crocidurae DOU TaxID=1293575 RepID=W5SRI7_9SPIR|nr:Variable major outer membrane lipoprotein [Borrelia crocidurae DOU]